LLAAGLPPGEIRQLLRSGFLHRAYRGVYIVGHLALAPLAKEQAALLACGPRSVISHLSAAHIWGLVGEPPTKIDVTLLRSQVRAKRGIRLHRATTLDQRDFRIRSGVRLTAPARTIVDLAAQASEVELERLIAEARVKRLLREGELEAALDRAGKRPGVSKLRALLRTEAGRAMTRSGVERLCRRMLKAAGLPDPKVNQRIGGYEVDFLWPQERVVLEVDTYTFHGHPRAFERDRLKTMALEDAGFHVIRVTRRQLLEQPYLVIAHVARALERYARAAA
jgi:very-short-patch-repair endonuclease